MEKSELTRMDRALEAIQTVAVEQAEIKTLLMEHLKRYEKLEEDYRDTEKIANRNDLITKASLSIYSVMLTVLVGKVFKLT